MKVNPEMIVLARKMRGMTQRSLADAIGQGQARISKLEGGVQTDISDGIADLLCRVLDVPIEFLTQEDELLAVGSSAYYYRKRAKLLASDRDKIHAVVNLHRIHLKRLLVSVEIEATRSLPKLDLEDYGGSVQKVAQALRAFWMMADGPIKNITSLLESAGVIIIPCDFGTKEMDATSLRLADMPPMIFINQNVPADRWRFTLAHELGHLVMHDIPHESMEDEADSFAAEFLIPEIEIKGQFQRMMPIRLQELATLKPYWRVSMNALLYRAGELGFLTDVQKSRLWAQMAKLGWRSKEPDPIQKEHPSTFKMIANYFTEQLKYSVDELQKLLRINQTDLMQLYGADFGLAQQRPSLRIV